jgi:prevent-host-death family protein
MNKHDPVWSLQEAKAKFSEVVRLAQSEGPQTVTVHGREAVIVSPVPQDKARDGRLTGADFLRALRSGPLFDIEIPPRPSDSTSRDFSFE